MTPRLARRAVCAGLAGMCAGAFFGFGNASAGEDESDRRYWVDRWNELRAKRKELSTDLEDARVEYRRGRIGNRGRGPERAELLDKIAKLESELAVVEEELEAFPDQARRAGALPGWFHED